MLFYYDNLAGKNHWIHSPNLVVKQNYHSYHTIVIFRMYRVKGTEFGGLFYGKLSIHWITLLVAMSC